MVLSTAMKKKELVRCDWTGVSRIMWDYHDTEWGVPLHDDHRHFEFIVLDGAQAGLSWETILKKRENYRKAFHGFDVRRVARYGDKDVNRLMSDAGIVRNRLKITSAIQNAKRFLDVQREFGTFDEYVWQFVGGRPIVNRFQAIGEIPPHSEESDAMSKDLKKRGFTFVGSTICYAYMQAAGMVNDHLVGCFRHREVQRQKK
jgi:DNA-3-methyladenine glycosylase I